MTKKNIVLLLVIVCFLAVMCISIWGKQPEIPSRVPVSSIVILNNEGNEITDVNQNSNRKEKIISIERSDEYTEENPFTYNFSVKVLPDNAADVSLNYEILKGEDIITITQETENNIHYFTITFKEQDECNIKFTTNKIDTVKTDYLLFIWSGNQDGGEIEIPF